MGIITKMNKKLNDALKQRVETADANAKKKWEIFSHSEARKRMEGGEICYACYNKDGEWLPDTSKQYKTKDGKAYRCYTHDYYSLWSWADSEFEEAAEYRKYWTITPQKERRLDNETQRKNHEQRCE